MKTEEGGMFRFHTKCPFCAHEWDGIASLAGGDGTPQPNDFSICGQCGGIMVLTEPARRIAQSDVDELSPCQLRKLGELQHAVRAGERHRAWLLDTSERLGGVLSDTMHEAGLSPSMSVPLLSTMLSVVSTEHPQLVRAQAKALIRFIDDRDGKKQGDVDVN